MADWVPKEETVVKVKELREILLGQVSTPNVRCSIEDAFDALEAAARNGCAGPTVEAILLKGSNNE